mmetsp:Transcript_63663/g.114601  ORF Transcript_63663/g.114601 Transcript_63663/m.114601 type:complete len:611 (-) Transcript_63663:128-1960(-)
MGQFLKVLLALGASLSTDAIWPFDASVQAPQEIQPQLPHGAPFAFGGLPVMVVEQHMGFNPWEDLHKNMERAVRQAGLPEGSGIGQNLAHGKSLEAQLGSMFQVFAGHHAGHVGLAQGSFQVDDDHHSRIMISAVLPGYEFGADPASAHPLSVRAVGKRSLVVTGTHIAGPMTHQWQRSFSLPKGSDIKNVSVTYSAATGNLTVVVPRRDDSDDIIEDESEDDSAELDDLLPPAFRAMRDGMPRILGHLAGPPGQQVTGQGGFLQPVPMGLDGILQNVLSSLNDVHPRYQLPPGGERPVPEDAVLNLVGCFAETQLDKVELKYYGNTNAASFAAMYWHAHSDQVPYFAMARHEEPMGHGFTAKRFAHEHEVPQWGVYDGCGQRCEDDEQRWCGCSNEASRGFGNALCQEGEKRFAVYKVGTAAAAEAAEDEALGEGNATAAAAGADREAAESRRDASPQGEEGPLATGTAADRSFWQLSTDGGAGGDSSPSIEITVPQGTVAQARGDQVFLFNSTEALSTGGVPTPPQKLAEDNSAATSGAAGVQEATASSPEPAAIAAAAPLGKVRLPVGVTAESCTVEHNKANGGQVLRCKLDQKDVQDLPIKVIDEL